MIKLKVLGARAVATNLRTVVRKLEKGAMNGVNTAAMIIESDSKAMAPVDTANLRASHFIFQKGKSVPQPRILPAAGVDVVKLKSAFMQTMAVAQSQVGQNTVRVGAAAFYATNVEYGNPSLNWKRGGPRFMRTARDRNVANVLQLAAMGALRGLN